MSLLSKLQAKGVKVYASTPLWTQTEVIETVKVDDNHIVVESEEFPGTFSMVIEEDNERVYVPLKSNTTPDQDEYVLAVFTASRDWDKYGIIKDSQKVFAV